MPRLCSMLACTTLLAACQSSDSPTTPTAAVEASAVTVVRTRQRVPIVEDAVIDNPCSGEQVQFHFDQLLLARDLEIVGRAFHTHITQLDRGSTGIGLTTGARYRQVGVQTGTAFFSGQIDEVQTFVAAGAIIGQGKTPDFRAHETFHLTITPDGTVRVEHDKFRFTCR